MSSVDVAARVRKLIALVKEKGDVLIVIQDFPDPDAIASAAALKLLFKKRAGVRSSVASGGTVGRAENRALLRYLGLNLLRVDGCDLARYRCIAMVDTQPGTGNNSLPSGIVPDVVIDHHPIRPQTRRAAFFDVRSRYGAASTILYGYLKEARVKPDRVLATALLYGIRSDTQDLGRDTSSADIDAVVSLYPIGNKRMLSEIEHAKVSPRYFCTIKRAVESARLYGKGLFVFLGEVEVDMIAEVADAMNRCEGVEVVVVVGCSNERCYLSVRTSRWEDGAGKFAAALVDGIGSGGGHGSSAGGEITVTDVSSIEAELRKRFASLLGVSRGRPLCDDGS